MTHAECSTPRRRHHLVSPGVRRQYRITWILIGAVTLWAVVMGLIAGRAIVLLVLIPPFAFWGFGYLLHSHSAATVFSVHDGRLARQVGDASEQSVPIELIHSVGIKGTDQPMFVIEPGMGSALKEAEFLSPMWENPGIIGLLLDLNDTVAADVFDERVREMIALHQGAGRILAERADSLDPRLKKAYEDLLQGAFVRAALHIRRARARGVELSEIDDRALALAEDLGTPGFFDWVV